MRLLNNLRPIYRPSRMFDNNIWNEMDRFFDDFNRNLPVNDERLLSSNIEVDEQKDHFLVCVDMPGIRKEDINLEIKDNIVTISGERKSRFDNREKEGSKNEVANYGSFLQSFSLPSTVDADKIEANYENGVLELFIPKSQMARSRKIDIQSGREGFFNRLLGQKKEHKDVTENRKT